MSTINIRAEEKLKKQAAKVLKNMGLDMTSAVKLFLNQVVLTGKIPFEIKTVNGLSPAAELEILKEQAILQKKLNSKEVVGYDNASDLHKAILDEEG